MRDRSLLHFNHLPELMAWAARQGWKPEPTKDTYEVLRLRRGKECAIFHRKSEAKEHVTVWGDSEKLTRQFLRSRSDQQMSQIGAQAQA